MRFLFIVSKQILIQKSNIGAQQERNSHEFSWRCVRVTFDRFSRDENCSNFDYENSRNYTKAINSREVSDKHVYVECLSRSYAHDIYDERKLILFIFFSLDNLVYSIIGFSLVCLSFRQMAVAWAQFVQDFQLSTKLRMFFKFDRRIFSSRE